LDTLDAKWGTKDGQKAADDVKKIVQKYKTLFSTATPSAKSKKGRDGNTRDSSNVSTNPYQDPKKAADDLLTSILNIATSTKLQQNDHNTGYLTQEGHNEKAVQRQLPT
jgi:hypothetical protein